MIKEKILGIKNIKLSKKAKKIAATAAVTFLVFLFFIWLGVGMYISVPEGSRGELWPMFGMYVIFPALIFFFGVKKVYAVVNGEEDDETENKNSEEKE